MKRKLMDKELRMEPQNTQIKKNLMYDLHDIFLFHVKNF